MKCSQRDKYLVVIDKNSKTVYVCTGDDGYLSRGKAEELAKEYAVEFGYVFTPDPVC